jgi:two-component system sensor histidine kinase QseC
VKPGRTLRARLLMGVLSAVTLIWLGVAGVGYLKISHELGELLDAHLAQAAAMLLAQLGEETGELELEHAPRLHRYQRQVAFQIWDGAGRLRLHSHSAPSSRLSSAEEGFSRSTVEGLRWRAFSLRREHDNTLIQVGERLDAREHLSAEVAENLLFPLAVALPLLAGLLIFAIGRALQPLNRVSQEVAIRDAGNLEPIPTAQAPGEILPLIEQLNGLFQRLQATLENERRFTADAAHELRTPLAGIRMQAQVARETADDGARQRALDAVLTGCDRAARLIEQLLTLARLEAVGSMPPREICDLSRLARDVLAELGPAAHEKRVTLELQATEPVLLLGNEVLLRVLLRNLIDNGIRYSPRDTGVTVRIQTDGLAACLEVIDQGCGLTPEERGRVMQRFYRVPGSKESGSGLGLSIASRIAALLGGDLSLHDGAAQRGLIVTVSLPMPPG